MNRQIVWAGAIPLETDLLNTNKNTMIALAKLASAIMGSSTYVRGLACTPTSPASMVVNIGAGEIYSLQNIDGTAYSSLAADITHSILKQGYTLDSQQFTLTAPSTSGYSINYLIQVTYADTDGGSTVLPYYNASNPSTAWSGPNNTGAAQYTVRMGLCTVSIKTGVAATTGTQTTPSPDTGYTGLYVITVAQGATTITAANISKYANAPFIPEGGLVDGIQRGTMTYAADTGTVNAYVVNLNPGILSLSNGMSVSFKAINANTGSSTLAVCGTGAYPLLTLGGQVLTGTEISANSIVDVLWSETLSSWLIAKASSAPLPVLPATKPNQAPQLQQVLQTSNNLSDLTSVSSAIINLGLANIALAGTGTGTLSVPVGYASLPLIVGGVKRTFIIQWGSTTVTTQTEVTVTLPVAFPTASAVSLASKGNVINMSGEYAVGCAPSGLTQIAIRNTSSTGSTNQGIFWIALGY
ncbi:TPA: hypothetical protein ACQ431_003021 [Citrobacter murliniae]